MVTISRIRNVMPLAFDGVLLLFPEGMEVISIGLLFLVYIGGIFNSTASTSWASNFTFGMIGGATDGILASILTGLIAVLTTALVGIFGWMIRDRLGWAERGQQIKINTERLDRIEERLESIPTGREHEAIMERMKELNESIGVLQGQIVQILSTNGKNGPLKR